MTELKKQMITGETVGIERERWVVKIGPVVH